MYEVLFMTELLALENMIEVYMFNINNYYILLCSGSSTRGAFTTIFIIKRSQFHCLLYIKTLKEALISFIPW